jgi:addiction module HigA family antidote
MPCRSIIRILTDGESIHDTYAQPPPHPREVLADTVLRKDGAITVTEFAKRLHMSGVALSRVVNGRAAVSAELAIRLAAALGEAAA